MDLDEYHKYVRMHLTLKLDLSDANLEAFMCADKEKKSLLDNVLGVLGASKSKGKSTPLSQFVVVRCIFVAAGSMAAYCTASNF